MTDSVDVKPTAGPPFPVWDEKDTVGSLRALFDFVVQRGQQQINWYQNNVKGVRFGSRFCRSSAVVFVGIGSLLPLIAAAGNALGWKVRIPFEFGYVAFAVAGGVLAFDKYFGLSTAWIRYIKTQLALEAAVDQLRLDWVSLLAPIQSNSVTADQVQALVKRLAAFIQYVDAQIQQETDAWILEFQSNLAELAKAAQARAEAQKPGQVSVTVTNADDFDEAPLASLDGTESKRTESGQCTFLFVPPGDHEVRVTAKKTGKPFSASQNAAVGPGGTSRVSLTVPSS